MNRNWKAAAVAVSAGVLIGGMFVVDGAGAEVSNYTSSLSGTNVVPPAANGYTGSATFTIDTTTFEVCVSATTDIPANDLPTEGVFIRTGAAGTNGSVVVDFQNDLNTCVTSDSATVSAIVADPSGFYFLVESDLFSNGALRGQLVLVPASTTTTSTTTSTPVPTSSTTTSTVAPSSGVRAVTATPSYAG